MSLLTLAVVLPWRDAPTPAGPAGLAIGLIALAVLAVYQLRAPWSEHTPSEPINGRAPLPARESAHLYWATSSALVVVLAVIVVERFVVLS